MEYAEFIRQVQDRAGLAGREAAARVARATLETLGERIDKEERDDLAAQLPAELKEPLSARNANGSFNVEEFFKRVSARADIGYPEAVAQSQAVVSVMEKAVSAGEIEDLCDQLPDEYAELFNRSRIH